MFWNNLERSLKAENQKLKTKSLNLKAKQLELKALSGTFQNVTEEVADTVNLI